MLSCGWIAAGERPAADGHSESVRIFLEGYPISPEEVKAAVPAVADEGAHSLIRNRAFFNINPQY